MSTKFEKIVAKHELERRKATDTDDDISRIQALPNSELERILAEPEEPETI